MATLGCSGVPSPPELDGPVGGFSTEIAVAHLERLARLGPRRPGTQADDRARAYLERVLAREGAESTRLAGSAGLDHLLASLPGRSTNGILVIVPYSLLGPAEPVDDSGLAIVLELVRAFSTTSRSYAITFAFADVRPGAEAAGSDSGEAGPPRGAEEFVRTRARLAGAGRDLLDALRREGRFEGTRAVLVLETRAGPGARIARDLRSHPTLRSLFWDAAERLGRGRLFPRSTTWSVPSGLQDALHAEDFGRVVTLADERQIDAARLERRSEEERRRTAGDDPDPSGWAGVGVVAYEGLWQWMSRFERVDAFAPLP